MSEEMAADPVLIRPLPISDAQLLSIRGPLGMLLDRKPPPPPGPVADPAEELSQSIAVFAFVLEGTTTAADEDFRKKCG